MCVCTGKSGGAGGGSDEKGGGARGAQVRNCFRVGGVPIPRVPDPVISLSR